MTRADIPDGARLWTVLWRAVRAVERFDRASIEATGLGLSDFAVLEMLLHKGPLPVNAIGRKVLLTSGSITTAVDRLEGRRLVRRRASPDDGRVTLVELTAPGRELIQRAFQEHARRLDRLVEILPPPSRTELYHLARTLGLHAESLHAVRPGADRSAFGAEEATASGGRPSSRRTRRKPG